MTEQEASITQTLQGTGCTEEEIQQFLDLRASGRGTETLRLLSQHWCSLVCRMHEAQKPVDIQNCFICELKKEQQSEK